MNRPLRWPRLLLAYLTPLIMLVAGCGGGGGGNADPSGVTASTQFTLGGSVSGLSSSGLVLANGSDTLAINANASSFTLATAIATGSSYSVTVKTQPTGLTCSVANGTGTMGNANVSNAVITCSANAFALGGSIAGLTTGGLVLANGGDTLAVGAGATSFTLPTRVAFGSGFSVTVQTQPAGQTCSVAGGNGTLGNADVTNIAVTCGVDSFTLGGGISGLTSDGLVLANGSDMLSVSANASGFTLPAAVSFGSSYNVAVQTQPAGLTCTVANGSGSMGAVNVSNVAVTCNANAFTLGGSLSGLTATGLVLANGSDTLIVGSGATSFTLPAAVAIGSGYAVTVQTQPTGLTCSVAGGSGTMGAANVSNVSVTCSVQALTLGGSISGLGSSGLVLANGSDTLTVAANATSFTMPAAVAFGSTYNVTVKTQAQDHTCTIANGSGTMGANNVSNITVSCVAASYTVSTFAGSGGQGNDDGNVSVATFDIPVGVAIDGSGAIYVSNKAGNTIRKITADGTVSTLAGSGDTDSTDGTGAAASFHFPEGIAVDGSGNVFVADSTNNEIRKITPAGVVSTFAGSSAAGSADGVGTAATFHGPTGVAVDGGGNLFVADAGNRMIRKITPAGVVTTLAGSGIIGSADGVGTAATFNEPAGIAVDASGNVYVADTSNHKIRKITPAGVVSTLAGSGAAGSANGSGAAASFNQPRGVAVDSSGNVFVAEPSGQRIRRITPAGQVSTLAGTGSAGSTDGPAASASFNGPSGIAVDASGNVLVAEGGNQKIRKISRD